nr:uncharacterized protein LOC127333897 [Lolium perenne]
MFQPLIPVKLEGNTNPKELLALYNTAMVATGANQKIMANWFPRDLKGTALSWLMHLPKESIVLWGELCILFVSAFQGGFKCPGALIQLYSIVQKEGERLHDFMLRFSQIVHTILEVEDADIIGTLTMNMRDKTTREELNMRPVRNTHELWDMADLCSLAEEGRLAPEDAARKAATGVSPGVAPEEGRFAQARASACPGRRPSAPVGVA